MLTCVGNKGGSVEGSRAGRGGGAIVRTGLEACAQRPSKHAGVCNKGGVVEGSRVGRGGVRWHWSRGLCSEAF